jgi:AraC family transcriptional regulator
MMTDRARRNIYILHRWVKRNTLIQQNMPQGNSEYINRIDRVINYLRNNLDRSIKLQELASVACFSEFHFHRIFGAVSGETVNNFTGRLRLEKAARLLRYSSQSIIDLALECGFSSPATFSRAFHKAYGTTPSRFRKSGEIKDSKICKDLFVKDEYVLPMTRQERERAFPVSVKKFPSWNVAYIRVSNSFEGDHVVTAFGKIIDWAKSQNIFADGTLFGMSIDDPSVTPKHLYRYEVCFATEASFDCQEGISKMKIPARTYAATRINGDIRRVSTAWDYLFRDWLISSEFEPEHAPAFEIFLNKEKALDWSNFELDLCVPIKPLQISRRGS